MALSLFLAIFVSCEEDNSKDSPLTNFVGLQAFANVEIAAGTSSTVEGKVYASNTSTSDRTFTLIVDETTTTIDAENYTVPTTVTIPAGSREGSFQVAITAIDLGTSGKEIHIGLAIQADTNMAVVSDIGALNVLDGAASTQFVIKASELCTLNKVLIEISTDSYGSETTWELYDQDLNIVANGMSIR
ncbi:hypothetical protein [Flavobacterium sp. 3HN19-14]|uniref:hypothetical protein n=1 Tax=Flavobacterium sp. 3HN19-14 TaxID=3448133 RepID=UPI003EE38F73